MAPRRCGRSERPAAGFLRPSRAGRRHRHRAPRGPVRLPVRPVRRIHRLPRVWPNIMISARPKPLRSLDRVRAALLERIKLVQEELVGIANEQTNRTLFLLTLVTELALPFTVIAGVFGMNVPGATGPSPPRVRDRDPHGGGAHRAGGMPGDPAAPGVIAASAQARRGRRASMVC